MRNQSVLFLLGLSWRPLTFGESLKGKIAEAQFYFILEALKIMKRNNFYESNSLAISFTWLAQTTPIHNIYHKFDGQTSFQIEYLLT